MSNTIKIDGKDFEVDALSDSAKQQLANVRAADREIARLQTQLALAQTARNAYANAAKSELEKA
jgi:hypothetical protein